MRILHIFQDNKFADFVVSAFSSQSDIENRFVYIQRRPDAAKPAGPGWVITSPEYLGSDVFIDDVRWCDAIATHFMTADCAAAIAKVPRTKVVIWSGWGKDYHDLDMSSATTLYESHTLALMRNHRSLRQSLFLRAKPFARQLAMYRGLRRVDVFSAPIPSDFAAAKSALKFAFRPAYAQINYGDVDSTFAIAEPASNKSGIVVGNSATPENNHLDTFEVLKRCDLGDHEIILPLSYGDRAYREVVINTGMSYFGRRLRPIVEFMPAREYAAMLSRSSALVLNNKRQQALGNIGIMLYMGGAAYLNRCSPLVPFLRGLGAEVNLTDDLPKVGLNGWRPLDAATVGRNRAALQKFWGHDQVRQNVRELISVVNRIRGTR